MKYLPFFVFCLALSPSWSQSNLTLSHIHAHNDYQKRLPFYEAYRLGAGSIEVDIILVENELYVAHDLKDIRKENTIDSLYLKPLQNIVRCKATSSCSTNELGQETIQLLVDIKSEGAATLQQLVRKLASYPPEVFTNNKNIKIVISGNVPPPSTWSNYPSFIYFDGRPGVSYNDEQLKRIALISDNFSKYSTWNGKGLIPKMEEQKLQTLISSVHAVGKKIRFWATPDHINSWKTLFSLGVDFVGTDTVYLFADYIRKQKSLEYTHTTSSYVPYAPTYLNNDKRVEVKNIILMIGDGMGLAQVYSGYTGNRGTLNLFNMLNIGFSITTSEDSYITDSAAGGTAMATGTKTNNRYVGVDSKGHQHPALPQIIKPMGIGSAVISAGDITDATPAAFYAHQPDRDSNASIALDFMTNPVDILIGGGSKHFMRRADDIDLFSRLRANGYTTSDRFSTIDTISSKKFILLDDNAVVSKEKGRGNFLSQALVKSMSTLGNDKRGFFIMAEGAQIDDGGHENSVSYVVREMIDFDVAIGEAIRFADSNGETLVIVTADHETGGLSLLQGDISKGYVEGNFSTPDHSGVMVPVFAYGPHSQDFRGVYQNTAIFEKILRIFQMYNK